MTAFVIFFGSVFVTLQTPSPLTLDDVVKIARQNAYTVATAEAEARRVQASVQEAKGTVLPKIGVNGTYTRFADENKVVLDPNQPPITFRPIDRKLIQLSLQQPVDITGAYGLAISAAWALWHATDALVMAAANDAAEQAKSAFFQVLVAEDLVAVAEENLANRKLQLQMAERRVAAGVAAKFDVIRAQTDVTAAEQELLRAKNGVQLAKAALNNVLARDVSTPFELTRPESPPPVPGDLGALTEMARQIRPELIAARMQLQYRKRFRQVQERGNLPTLTISANLDHNPDAKGLGSEKETLSATALLNIPLFEGGVTKARVRQAREEEHKAEIAVQQAQNAVDLQVKQAFLDVQTARKVIEVAKRSVEQANEALRLARLRYEAGVGTPLEVSDAATAFTIARTNLVRAEFDYAVAYGRLQRAVGKEDLK